jgi:hypothetical protein
VGVGRNLFRVLTGEFCSLLEVVVFCWVLVLGELI